MSGNGIGLGFFLLLAGSAAATVLAGAASAAPSLAAGGIALPPISPANAPNPPPPATAAGTAGHVLTLPDAGVPAVVSGGGRTFYVDYDGGRDSNSGTAAAQAWKHAPGDSAATGGAASTALRAGDTVRFRGGVSYRGSVAARQSGTAASPIVYTGTGFGVGRAIMDGGDPATSAAPCASQAACGGATNWRSLWLVSFAAPKTSYHKLYDAAGPLSEAMTPASADPFWDDTIDDFATIPVAQANAVASGRLENAALAAAARNEPNARLAIWIYGNEVVQRTIEAVAGNVIYFDATGVTPFRDRNGKAAVVGGVRGVNQPGYFALIGATKAVVYPRAAGEGRYYVGNGRSLFDLNGKSNIRVHGFDFTRGTAGTSEWNWGVAIRNSAGTVANILFDGNRIYDFSLRNGYGPIQLGRGNGITIRGNVLDTIENGSGMRIGSDVLNLTVERNSIRKVGRTAIYVQDVQTGVVRYNIVSEILGVHGNGISAYLGNQNVRISNNCVFNSLRPLTYEGAGSSSPVANLSITGNILVTSPEARAAVSSWGNNTRGVTIENNVALGQNVGLLLSQSDQNVRVVGNRTSGIEVSGAGKTVPPGWTISGNNTASAIGDAQGLVLQQGACSARGLQGVLSVQLF